ncbi:MAG: hypothetical protein IJ192_13055 [Clostridia bacterium]|nr:hypothetical protein [Clostridia bacterium]
MDKMKTMVAVMTAMLIAVGIFALILNLTKNDLETQVTENSGKPSAVSSTESSEPEIEQDLLFLGFYQNKFYSADVSGYLIDSKGKRYDFELTDITEDMTPEKILKAAKEKKSSLKGTDYISAHDISNLYEILNEVDPKGKHHSETLSEQTGTTELYGITYKEGKETLVKIYTYGDVEETPEDANALTLRKYFMKKAQSDGQSSVVDETE